MILATRTQPRSTHRECARRDDRVRDRRLCLALPAIACVERKEVGSPPDPPRAACTCAEPAFRVSRQTPSPLPSTTALAHTTAPVIHPSALTLPTPPYPCPLDPSSVIHHPSPSSLLNTTCLPNCTHSYYYLLGLCVPPFHFSALLPPCTPGLASERLASAPHSHSPVPLVFGLHRHCSAFSLGSASVFSPTVPPSLSHSLHTHPCQRKTGVVSRFVSAESPL